LTPLNQPQPNPKNPKTKKCESEAAIEEECALDDSALLFLVLSLVISASFKGPLERENVFRLVGK
jgi:hypothetical protein